MKAWVVWLGALLLAGCSSSSPTKSLDLGGDDANAIGTLLDDFAEMGTNPKKADQIFVKGSRPTDLRPYSKFTYSLVGKPRTSGTTGTCTIRVDSPKTGAKVAELEWTFEKDGSTWKVNTAPLP